MSELGPTEYKRRRDKFFKRWCDKHHFVGEVPGTNWMLRYLYFPLSSRHKRGKVRQTPTKDQVSSLNCIKFYSTKSHTLQGQR